MSTSWSSTGCRLRKDGRDLGAVVTVRDRTELEGLLRELDSVDAMTNALRAQQHEFSNRMHTVAGLIELGDHDQAARYAVDVSGASSGLAEAIRERIERPELAAMLLAKTTIASERGVELAVSGDSRLEDVGNDVGVLLTIAGNLIDNAIDAAASGPKPARVTVRLVAPDGRSRSGARHRRRGAGRARPGDLHGRLHDQARRGPTPPWPWPRAGSPAGAPSGRHDRYRAH